MSPSFSRDWEKLDHVESDLGYKSGHGGGRRTNMQASNLN